MTRRAAAAAFPELNIWEPDLSHRPLGLSQSRPLHGGFRTPPLPSSGLEKEGNARRPLGDRPGRPNELGKTVHRRIPGHRQHPGEVIWPDTYQKQLEARSWRRTLISFPATGAMTTPICRLRCPSTINSWIGFLSLSTGQLVSVDVCLWWVSVGSGHGIRPECDRLNEELLASLSLDRLQRLT